MFDDVETLREKLVELSEINIIVQTKKFLMNKKRCTELVLRKNMTEYEERRKKLAKTEMAISLVSVIPAFMEWSRYFWFKDGAESFSEKIMADENIMFCITDLMPAV